MPLVSTVIMTAVLAKLVGIRNRGLHPPAADGSIAPGMLAALGMVGIDEVYRGGRTAVGAMAYGTCTIPAVDKIFGPGNAYVMEAKRQVLGTVGIDLLPGPSEVMVIADAGANPEHVAADLIAQAEHGSGKEIIYFASTSKALLAKVEKACAKQVPERSHAAKIEAVLKSRLLVVLQEPAAMCTGRELYCARTSGAASGRQVDRAPTRQITTAGAILQAT